MEPHHVLPASPARRRQAQLSLWTAVFGLRFGSRSVVAELMRDGAELLGLVRQPPRGVIESLRTSGYVCS